MAQIYQWHLSIGIFPVDVAQRYEDTPFIISCRMCTYAIDKSVPFIIPYQILPPNPESDMEGLAI